MNTFDTKSYKARLQEFPEISYQEYQQITDLDIRKDIAKKNKIIPGTVWRTGRSERTYDLEVGTWLRPSEGPVTYAAGAFGHSRSGYSGSAPAAGRLRNLNILSSSGGSAYGGTTDNTDVTDME